MLEKNESPIPDLIRIGEVSSVNYEVGTVRVTFDDEEFISGDLQVIQKNTFESQDYWMPDVGEDVLCVFLLNGNGDGFVIGSFYAGEVEPPENAISGKVRLIKFKDDSEFYYDFDEHKLFAKIGDTEIEANGEKVKITADIEFNGDLKVNGKITATGDVKADGEVTAKASSTISNLSTHVHPTPVGPSSAPTPGT